MTPLHHLDVPPTEDARTPSKTVVVRLELVSGARTALAALVGSHPRERAKMIATALERGAVRVDEEGEGVEFSLDAAELA